MRKILSWLALFIYFVFTFTLFPTLVPCLVHCVQFHSWEKCDSQFEVILVMSAFIGASGLLWVTANYREYYFTYNWLIVIAELIVLEIGYIAYAHTLSEINVWQWELVFFGFLICSFIMVLFYVLASKKIIKNRLIENLLHLIPNKTDT
ncbi:uncharacterized protein LOC108029879 [Drosophila biarmipes]|uniref:uncharacterized protein LOC108029879 n=1 Tax=Drosophila biarmipes TaxID=125945 RepID=UPI0007E7BBA6|nr:uncharacterized protein LOC108029879 [Drosophila biarmipes]